MATNITAPIVLFVYNRPWHTRQTLNSLLRNELAKDSDLIVFSDAPKSPDVAMLVTEVRSLLKGITGFKSVRIIERDNNWGLSKSIIEGVTEVVNRYGKVIVLEDDIVTSPSFLQFMNQALDYYEKENRVWHISGWTYPIDTEGLGDAFLWRFMNCWGWATWADRWINFEKNPQRLIENWSEHEKHHFDLDGSGVAWYQVVANLKAEMDTWAIFWYATIYENNGLCINPVRSYVKNIGHDGSGMNCSKLDHSGFTDDELCESVKINWPNEIKELDLARKRVMNYVRNSNKNIFGRIINKLRKYFKNQKKDIRHEM